MRTYKQMCGLCIVQLSCVCLWTNWKKTTREHSTTKKLQCMMPSCRLTSEPHQTTVRTRGRCTRRAHEFPSASGHSTHCWAHVQCNLKCTAPLRWTNVPPTSRISMSVLFPTGTRDCNELQSHAPRVTERHCLDARLNETQSPWRPLLLHHNGHVYHSIKELDL